MKSYSVSQAHPSATTGESKGSNDTVTSIFAPEIAQAFAEARQAADEKATKKVTVNGVEVAVPYPFPSPTDWRDCWMYFLMLDRFANDRFPPVGPWNQRYDFRQGGTFCGVTAQLDYLKNLGVRALWISPVLKNSRPGGWPYVYPGYDTQDFLHVDARLGSDGTRATAEQELQELVLQAHARGIYVIVDMVINHAGQVFDYVYQNNVVEQFADPGIMFGPLGDEPPIEWVNGYGFPRADRQDQVPAGGLSPDDAVYPVELQQKLFFRRRGSIVDYNWSEYPAGFIKGDFVKRRQLVVEYDATPSSQGQIQASYGSRPVLNILIRIYEYLIAKFDFDGFRIDTVKHVEPDMVETFGNAMREFAQTIGKRNFFTIGEIYDSEQQIDRFVGRHSTATEGFGIDAALDYPLFFQLTGVAKSQINVSELARVFDVRKQAEAGLISSHGEAGSYFVTFLDNHDQTQRFNTPSTPEAQVTMGLSLLFSLPGIPAVYYGTEQGLVGTVDAQGYPDLINNESVREALWGKRNAFNNGSHLYQQIQALGKLRSQQPALRFGRLYFRQVSGNGSDFGYSSGAGGVVAFSRVVSDIEVLVVANTNTKESFDGFVLQDPDLNRHPRQMQLIYSNVGNSGSTLIRRVSGAQFFNDGQLTGSGDVAALPVKLAPMEAQFWAPLQPFQF